MITHSPYGSLLVLYILYEDRYTMTRIHHYDITIRAKVQAVLSIIAFVPSV